MSRRSFCSFFLCKVAVILSAGAVQADDVFRAAVSRTEITPADSQPMWGYSAREGPSTGILDPLYAKILLLEAGESRVALVTLDLGRTFGQASMQAVRARVQRSARVDQVFFCASHTHSGPVIEDWEAGRGRPAWETTALGMISAAIERAAESLAPARIGAGYGETLIGHNRRAVQPDGSVKMLWRNVSKLPTEPVDPRVGVIRVDDMPGKPMAVVVNYACHPVVLGPDNRQFSADFPGAMAAHVEGQFKETPLCLFLQAACGDINPYYDKMPLEQDGVRLMQQTGIQLGDEVVRVAREIETSVPERPELRYALTERRLESRWNADELLARLKSDVPAEQYERYARALTAPLDSPVMTLLINNELAVMGMPGEPFIDFALDFRNRSPVKDAFFAGYANGYCGYFPTIEAAVAGGYGADSIGARAEVGAGEWMVDQAVIRLYEMLGQLAPVPSR